VKGGPALQKLKRSLSYVLTGHENSLPVVPVDVEQYWWLCGPEAAAPQGREVLVVQPGGCSACSLQTGNRRTWSTTLVPPAVPCCSLKWQKGDVLTDTC